VELNAELNDSEQFASWGKGRGGTPCKFNYYIQVTKTFISRYRPNILLGRGVGSMLLACSNIYLYRKMKK
jgi:hypothetical protein